MDRVNLLDESTFETGGGLWTGKKGPFATATVIRNTNFTESGRVDYSDVAVLDVEAKQLAKRRLASGDIIVERSGGGPNQPVGRVVFFDRDEGVFSHSNFTSRLRVIDTERFLPKFVFYFLLYFHDSKQTDHLQRRTTGIRNLDWQAYRESAAVPLFALSEQRQIAAVLSAVQRAIERQERLIALTAELKKALMHKLFTEGTRHEPLKQTEIGPVPKSWSLSLASESFAIQEGQVDPTQSPYREMLHVGPENIEPGSGRLLRLRTNGELGIKSGNYLFTSEHILYSKIRPYLNKVTLPSFTGTCSADMYPLLPQRRRFSRSFLFQYLLSPSFVKQASSHQERTGIPKINRNQLSSTQIPTPPPEEQSLIDRVLSTCDVKLSTHIRTGAALNALFRCLLHQLMTAQISVRQLNLSALGIEEIGKEPAGVT
ncbi:MAG TPA: restriction endonuclease subunit S [Tepidisphaeraceae bacterium]|nr:restriction endonuclease subunit S [Tepidisphaeraceae bacterium]